MSLMAGFPGFGTHATDLTALDQYIEQAAVRIQRAFRRLSKQRSKCLGSTVARPQLLTVYIQPEDEGGLDSKVDSSVADTEASQASTLLACLLLACQAFTLSSRHRRHPRRLVSIASESRAWSTSRSWAPRPTADSPGCFTAPQPDGSNALSDDDASVCTAAARMAPDSGSHWNRASDFADCAARRLEWCQSTHS